MVMDCCHLATLQSALLTSSSGTVSADPSICDPIDLEFDCGHYNCSFNRCLVSSSRSPRARIWSSAFAGDFGWHSARIERTVFHQRYRSIAAGQRISVFPEPVRVRPAIYAAAVEVAVPRKRRFALLYLVTFQPPQAEPKGIPIVGISVKIGFLIDSLASCSFFLTVILSPTTRCSQDMVW